MQTRRALGAARSLAGSSTRGRCVRSVSTASVTGVGRPHWAATGSVCSATRPCELLHCGKYSQKYLWGFLS